MWWVGVYMDCALTGINPVGYYHTNAILLRQYQFKEQQSAQDRHPEMPVLRQP
jgi:succinyl-CoA synthetase beta subunit